MVRIFTDTSSMFTPEDGRQMSFDVAPLTVTIAGKTYREREEIETKEFIDLINEGNIPTSSQPAPADLIEVYEKATAENPVLHITIADGLSGAYKSACGVRETMENKEHIYVYNSQSLCGPQWIMVKSALKMANEGATVEEIIKVLDVIRLGHKSILIPMDFGYLRRGGRLSPTAAAVGSLLKMVPVMSQRDDDGTQLTKVGLARGVKKACEMGLGVFPKYGINEDSIIICAHSGNPEQGQLMMETAKAMYQNCREYHLFELTPAFTVQGGPKCITVQMCPSPVL
ncbi:MAG: DegV family protein [Ruminococcaceae bacterium]|nr:DegV family protein [Oscillospiraceae bacterium]